MKMYLNEAIKMLQDAGLIVETRRFGMSRNTVSSSGLNEPEPEPLTVKKAILNCLHGSFIGNKMERDIVANWLKDLIGSDDVYLFNGNYKQQVINHMSYAPEGYRDEKGTFVNVDGENYLIWSIPGLRSAVENEDKSWQDLIKRGDVKRLDPNMKLNFKI